MIINQLITDFKAVALYKQCNCPDKPIIGATSLKIQTSSGLLDLDAVPEYPRIYVQLNELTNKFFLYAAGKKLSDISTLDKDGILQLILAQKMV